MRMRSLALLGAALVVGGITFASVARRDNNPAPAPAQPPSAAQNQAPPNTARVGEGWRHFRRAGYPDRNRDGTVNRDPSPDANANAGANANANANAGANADANAGASPAAPAQQGAAPAATADPVAEVIRLVNVERSRIGLSPMTQNTKLSGVASTKASDMATKNYFSHDSPTYGDPFQMMERFGITYTAAGENIAQGQTSPQEVMTGWMNSPGHRQNILDTRFTQIGVGYDSHGNYWVQQFIRP